MLNIFPSLTFLKILSALWLFGTALILKKYWGKKAFILLANSPMLWYISVEVSPILPVTFFFTLSYYFMDKWKEKKSLKHLLYTGFFSGLCVALWGGGLFLVGMLVLIYLLNEKTINSAWFLAFVGLGFSVRLIVDQIVFGFFLQTTLRYFGANITTLFGLGASKVPTTTLDLLWRVLVWLSPALVFIFYKFKKKYWREVGLISLFLLFFFLRSGHPRGIKYFIIITPLIAIVLSKILTNKQILATSLIGLLLAFTIAVPPHFYPIHDIPGLYHDDLVAIEEELGYDQIIAGPSQALEFGMILFDEGPEIIWYEDYFLYLNDEKTYSSYSYQSKQTNLPLRKRMNLELSLTNEDGKELENLPLVLPKDREVPLDDYELEKCFETLCVYTRVK